jgi:hypothetical protein
LIAFFRKTHKNRLICSVLSIDFAADFGTYHTLFSKRAIGLVLLLGIFRRAPHPSDTRGHPYALSLPRGHVTDCTYCFVTSTISVLITRNEGSGFVQFGPARAHFIT